MSEKKDKRNDIQKEIDEAYKFIGALQASGDAVDLIASARLHLRKAYELAAEKPGEKEEEHGG